MIDPSVYEMIAAAAREAGLRPSLHRQDSQWVEVALDRPGGERSGLPRVVLKSDGEVFRLLFAEGFQTGEDAYDAESREDVLRRYCGAAAGYLDGSGRYEYRRAWFRRVRVLIVDVDGKPEVIWKA